MTPERFAHLRAALARRQPDLTVLADNVHKPHNVAALLRTCDAVGVLEIHAVAPQGSFPRPRGVSGSARDWVRTRMHRRIQDAAFAIKELGCQIVAAHFSADSVDYRSLDYTRPTAFLMGSELHGVSAEAAALADRHAVIPMRGLISSLNVSVATALFLYEAARQREAAGLYARSRLSAQVQAEVLFEWCHPDVAARCRRRGIPYPPLTATGDIAANPFHAPGGGVAGTTGE